MKALITLNFLILFITCSWGQSGGTCPKIQFTYDNAGNRIKRMYVTCFADENTNPVALKTQSQISKVSLKVYPNPNNGVFQVSIENPKEEASLVLYDLTGRKVHIQQVANESTTVDVSNMASGTYMMIYREPEKILSSMKVVIE